MLFWHPPTSFGIDWSRNDGCTLEWFAQLSRWNNAGSRNPCRPCSEITRNKKLTIIGVLKFFLTLPLSRLWVGFQKKKNCPRFSLQKFCIVFRRKPTSNIQKVLKYVFMRWQPKFFVILIHNKNFIKLLTDRTTSLP